MIWAGIVVYNPKMNRLYDNIKGILPQVDGLAIYNNGCNEDLYSLLSRISDKKKICILGTGNNVGLARALNEVVQCAADNQAKWIITLDQDSVVPHNLVEQYKMRMSIDECIGIICPRVIDKRRVYMVNSLNERKDEFVERCITSASCTRIDAWNEVGKFDEKLFVDLIDNDFCKRLRIGEWKILKINEVILDQEFGDIAPKSKKVVKFYYELSKKIKSKYLATNIAKLTYKKNVSPMRVYYTNRNIVYLNKKYSRYGGIGYENYCCRTYLGFMVTFNLASIVRGKNKIKILKSVITGIYDGKRLPVTVLD